MQKDAAVNGSDVVRGDALLNYDDVSEVLGISVHTLRRMVMMRSIPFIKIGSSVRFDIRQLAKHYNFELPLVQKPFLNPKPAVGCKTDISSELRDAVEWLSSQAKRFAFGEMTIHVLVHEGRVKYIHRTVTEKRRID